MVYFGTNFELSCAVCTVCAGCTVCTGGLAGQFFEHSQASRHAPAGPGSLLGDGDKCALFLFCFEPQGLGLLVVVVVVPDCFFRVDMGRSLLFLPPLLITGNRF